MVADVSILPMPKGSTRRCACVALATGIVVLHLSMADGRVVDLAKPRCADCVPGTVEALRELADHMTAERPHRLVAVA